MNWKEEAVRRLMDYKVVANSVGGMRKELLRLELEAESLGSSGVFRMGSGNQSRDDRKMNNLVRRGELSDALQQAALWVDVTDHALGCLEQEDQELLSALYITGEWGNVTQVARELGMERSSVYRRRDEALRKFTVAMYGKC